MVSHRYRQGTPKFFLKSQDSSKKEIDELQKKKDEVSQLLHKYVIEKEKDSEIIEDKYVDIVLDKKYIQKCISSYRYPNMSRSPNKTGLIQRYCAYNRTIPKYAKNIIELRRGVDHGQFDNSSFNNFTGLPYGYSYWIDPTLETQLTERKIEYEMISGTCEDVSHFYDHNKFMKYYEDELYDDELDEVIDISEIDNLYDLYKIQDGDEDISTPKWDTCWYGTYDTNDDIVYRVYKTDIDHTLIVNNESYDTTSESDTESDIESISDYEEEESLVNSDGWTTVTNAGRH